jgi:hypothetical protein
MKRAWRLNLIVLQKLNLVKEKTNEEVTTILSFPFPEMGLVP